MKVKVTQTFRDKDNYNLVYKVGEEREFGKSRAQHLISLGLVELISIAQEPTEGLFLTDGKRKHGRKSSK
jgi:hypothetical protein